MLIKASATTVVVIVLGCASPCLARDAGGSPTVDIKKTCQETVNALGTSSLGGEVGRI